MYPQQSCQESNLDQLLRHTTIAFATFRLWSGLYLHLRLYAKMLPTQSLHTSLFLRVGSVLPSVVLEGFTEFEKLNYNISIITPPFEATVLFIELQDQISIIQIISLLFYQNSLESFDFQNFFNFLISYFSDVIEVFCIFVCRCNLYTVGSYPDRTQLWNI